MSDTSKAVFLSYASQDAEAAKRMCEALRAAGIEVWFDQNELVGGDAWDAKIRKQIADCALFLPVISAATQARREGYFRLEWKLAAQRTHMMSERTAFLLPVVIDATRDAEADVPTEFRAVQWTRLPAGETPPAFCARVKQLLGGEGRDAFTRRPPSDIPESPGRLGETSLPANASRAWLVPAILGVAAVAALALWQPWRAKEKSAPPTSSTSPAATISPAAPLTEAQQLVAKARTILDEGDEMNRETYNLAEDLLKRAEALDISEASAWALHAQLSASRIIYGLDRSDARREALKTQANRALQLAPNSMEAQIADARARLIFEPSNPELVPMLQALALRYPGEWRFQMDLSRCFSRNGKMEDSLSLEAIDRALKLAPDQPSLKSDRINVLILAGRSAQAEREIAGMKLGRTGARLLAHEVYLKLTWSGDLVGAADAVRSWPAWFLLEDRGVGFAAMAALWRHDSAVALEIVARFPRDYITDYFYTGPRAVLSAWAHEQAGHVESARHDWRVVVQVAERELAGAPENLAALHWKGWALARLGETEAAVSILKQLQERDRIGAAQAQITGGLGGLALILGRLDEAIALISRESSTDVARRIRGVTKTSLRLNPVFDALRSDPRFQALIDAAQGPEEKKDNASAGAASLDPKSVAVLAFANLSAEKDSEYFSDGLSEEIWGKLARNPALRMIATTSSFSYKGKNAPISQIGRELNVGTIIEGSVRRDGNQLRITAKLIHAADGTQVWFETYNKELTTAGIFAIQEEIALKIAAQLAPSSAPVQSTVAAVPTKNLAAYEAYLRGREQQTKGVGGMREASGFFERATELDPGFAIAWVQLARIHASLYYNGLEDEDRAQSLARAAIDQTQRLQPDLPDIHLALAAFRFYVETDLPSAIRELDLLARIRPEDGETLQLRGNIFLNFGRFADSIEVCQRSVSLDPKNLLAWNSLGLSLGAVSRYSEAVSAYQHSVQMIPTSGSVGNRAGAIFRWKGDPKMTLESFRDIPLAKLPARGMSDYINYYWMAGDHAKAIELIDDAGWSGTLAQSEYLFRDLVKARVRESMGDSEGARRDYLAALPQVERTRDAHPRSFRAYLPLAQVYAGLGRKEEALAAARRSVELMPPSRDPRRAANTSLRVLVNVEGRFGMVDEALDIVRQQITAGWWKRNDLLYFPDFIHLQKDPRFRTLAEKAPL